MVIVYKLNLAKLVSDLAWVPLGLWRQVRQRRYLVKLQISFDVLPVRRFYFIEYWLDINSAYLLANESMLFQMFMDRTVIVNHKQSLNDEIEKDLLFFQYVMY